MGYHFDGRDPKTGAQTRFYFSLRDMQISLAGNPDLNLGHKQLSLGTKIEDWYNETSEFTQTLYDALIDDALEIFAMQGDRDWNHRKVEILVGHVCHGLAQRLARSRKQLETLPPGVQPIMQEPELSREVDLGLPMSTSGAMGLLMSDHFGQVVDRLVSDHYFGLQSTWLVKCKPIEAVPSIRPTPALALAIRKLYLTTQKLIARRSRSFRISIASSYLGKIGTIGIGFLVRQWPLFLELKPASRHDRNSIGRKVLIGEDPSILGIAKGLLHTLIPSSVLENFELTLEEGLKMGFPEKPKVVFTSNAFFYDDHFKVHVAKNIPGALYIVAQHGGTYGVSRLDALNVELRTPDYILSWGWPGEKVLPFGQVKPKVRAKLANKVKGVTLFLRNDMPSLLFADMGSPNDEYFRAVTILCRELNRLEVSAEIRLHTSTSEVSREFLEREVREFPFVRFSRRGQSVAKLLRSGQAPVFTYDSSGILELASERIPSFSFMPDGLKLVRNRFTGNYQNLREAGLLSEEPVEAARLIARWVTATPDVRRVQEEAVKSFSEGIVFYPARKLRSLSSLLLHASANGDLSSWTK